MNDTTQSEPLRSGRLFGELTDREIKLLRRACYLMEIAEQDYRDENSATYGDFNPAIRHRANSVRRERRWNRLRMKLSTPNIRSRHTRRTKPRSNQKGRARVLAVMRWLGSDFNLTKP